MSEEISSVIGRIPSGLFILTATSSQGDETGMLASWVQQASFEPPAFTISVNVKRYLRAWIEVGSTITVSQIGETQKSVLGHFGKGFEPGQNAFEGVEIGRSPSGNAILKDALSWMEGTVSGILTSGDHDVLLVTVTGSGQGPRLNTEKPWVHVRKNGLHY